MNFSDINWGEDEAKGDPDLAKYFLRIPDFDRLIDGRKRYIIGRKGTGKTALLEKIRIDAELSQHAYKCRNLSLKDFPLNDIRGLRDRSMQDKSQFVPIWTFLIIVEFCKLIVDDNYSENSFIKSEISIFLKKNKLDVNGGFVQTIHALTSKESKINVASSLFGGEIGNKSQAEVEIVIHYTKAIEPLKELLKKILSPTKYFMLFDELDEGYSALDPNKRLLILSLFRAIENVVIDFRSTKLNLRPILALRSDIFERLADNDLNKYDDFIVRLNWQADSRFNYSIKELVNARIHSSINTNKDDSWHVVCRDFDRSIPSDKKSVWRYLYVRTFERPRDIIKFLKYSQHTCPKGVLFFENVKHAENSYSDWFYREIRDEIQSHLPVWKEAMGCLSKVGRGILQTEDYKNMALHDREIKKYLESNNYTVDNILETLFEFSVIGNLDENDRWIFKYKDHDLTWSPSRRICVHFGLQKKLRLGRQYNF